LDSVTLDITDSQKADIHLRGHALSSLLSPISGLNALKALSATWRISWAVSMPLYSAMSI
jgi:hypothetical protein